MNPIKKISLKKHKMFYKLKIIMITISYGFCSDQLSTPRMPVTLKTIRNVRVKIS